MEGEWNERVGLKKWDGPGVRKKEVAERGKEMEGNWKKG